MYLEYVASAVQDRADVAIFTKSIIEGFVMVSRSSLPHSLRGFTLVELMVVIVIMAILAVLAAPSFGVFIAKQQTRSAAYELAQTLQTARSNAILNRRSVDVRASYPNASTGGKWNGAKTSSLNALNVTASDVDRLAKSSFYILETGSGLNNAVAGVVNRVTQIATLDTKVIINADPVLIRFTPGSTVQTSLSTSATTPTDLTGDVTFVITYAGSSNAGYTVTLSHFGGTQVKRN